MKRLVAEETKKMIILRGAPGSGKSTKAKELANTCNGAVICSADDYFIKDGKYIFVMSQLQNAHTYCYHKAVEAVKNNASLVIIDNTNTRHWEYEAYEDLAKEYNYKVEIIVCNGKYKNVHNAPEDKVQIMRDRFEE